MLLMWTLMTWTCRMMLSWQQQVARRGWRRGAAGQNRWAHGRRCECFPLPLILLLVLLCFWQCKLKLLKDFTLACSPLELPLSFSLPAALQIIMTGCWQSSKECGLLPGSLARALPLAGEPQAAALGCLSGLLEGTKSCFAGCHSAEAQPSPMASPTPFASPTHPSLPPALQAPPRC